ncbi:MAG: putative O-glycosylation ligase, exosortase A system-associated [Thiobacillus sp.]|nr:putative O-glycosylation ligase, exosortase A system-associated [Thiobacillus sp.]
MALRDLVVFGIVFLALPFVFKRPWVGILLWTWLAYMNPHRQAWGAAYDFPFSMIVGLVTIAAFVLTRDKNKMLWTRETVTLVIFIVWMFITSQFAFYPELAALQWNKVWKIHLMIFLVLMLIQNKQQLNWMVWVIVLSLGYYGVKGGIFTIMHGGQFRVQGPADTFIGGNNEMALALVMLVPLIRYLHLQATRGWERLGLAAAMVLTGVAAIGSQSRGALVAMALMGLFLILKSRKRFTMLIYGAIGVALVASIMPQEWRDRMNTIETYQEDNSALGRINAWHTAFNVAKSRITGGGYEMFQPPVFRQYAPEPFRVHDVHSIYFEQIGEQGFIGFGLWLSLGIFTWLRARQVIRACKDDPERKWAADLAAMIQVSMVGYASGGAFLGLSYWDLPYHLMATMLLTARFTGVLEPNKTPARAVQAKPHWSPHANRI